MSTATNRIALACARGRVFWEESLNVAVAFDRSRPARIGAESATASDAAKSVTHS